MSIGLERLRSIIESLLLISSDPIPYARLSEIVRAEHPEVDESSMGEAIQSLVQQYRDETRPIALGIRVEDIGGALQYRTVGENGPYVRRMLAAKPQKLSKPALETLAVIAYRQPVTKTEVEAIRGVDAGAALKSLLEHDLIRIMGKREEIGRPIIYGTTKQFLQFFGLRGLGELPTLREYHELDEEHQRKVDDLSEDKKRKLVDLAAAAHFLNERESDPDLDALDAAVSVADRVRRAAEQVLNPAQPPDAAVEGDGEAESSAASSEAGPQVQVQPEPQPQVDTSTEGEVGPETKVALEVSSAPTVEGELESELEGDPSQGDPSQGDLSQGDSSQGDLPVPSVLGASVVHADELPPEESHTVYDDEGGRDDAGPEVAYATDVADAGLGDASRDDMRGGDAVSAPLAEEEQLADADDQHADG